ncbi:hypothetical protein GBA52_010034 [Prunus armeniaca]|nr:hypothetical protein GBA52_010034 [Prunus armeniaca]
MKDAKSSKATNDELLTVTFKEHNRDVVENSLATSSLKTCWVGEVSQGCMMNNLSSRVLDFKGVEVTVTEHEVHNGEVKTRDGKENVVGSVATKKKFFAKVIMEGTPKGVELDIRVEENGHQQQTHKEVLLKVEPSSLARSRPKESIKSSHEFGWNDKVNSTTFQSTFGTMNRESWIGAVMRRNKLVHKSNSKGDGCVGIYRTGVGMQFTYQDISRIQDSKKAKSKEFDMMDLSSIEIWVAQV